MLDHRVIEQDLVQESLFKRPCREQIGAVNVTFDDIVRIRSGPGRPFNHHFRDTS